MIGGTAALGLVSVHLVGRRILAWMHALKRIHDARRQQRVTLVHTTRWILNILLMVSALLMLLSEFGVDVTPLLASAGVAGLAVRLGAQSLIKDLSGGLLILIESQIAVGDSIVVGAVWGLVERTTLRTAQLRALNGDLYVVPNGEVGVLANQTWDWSRIVVGVGVACEEDPDRALSILEKSAVALARGPAFGLDLLKPLQVPGVNSLGDSAAMVRIVVKTQPGKQSAIAHALHRLLLATCEREGGEPVLSPPGGLGTCHAGGGWPGNRRVKEDKMLRALCRTPKGAVHTDLSPGAFAAVLKEPDALLWVDLAGEPPEACEPILRQVFGFHPLAVDDALQESHAPKVDHWDTYLYIVLHAVTLDQADQIKLDTLELDVFGGANYLVTHRIRPIAATDRLWANCQRDERHLQKGSTHLLYALADELVADYMPVVEGFDEAIDRIGDLIFSAPTSSLLEQIFALKRALLHLRRIIALQREALNKLARGDYAVINAKDRVFFRDVYDHLVRLYDISESLRDLVGGALDTYLSVVNNRMNDVMKTLTVITTLFMPVSFLAGFFGMNFSHATVPLEAWTGRVAFGLMATAMILLPLGMFLWIRRRAWM